MTMQQMETLGFACLGLAAVLGIVWAHLDEYVRSRINQPKPTRKEFAKWQLDAILD